MCRSCSVYSYMYTPTCTFAASVNEHTCDSPRHDILHLAACRHDSRAQVIHNEYLYIMYVYMSK